MSLQRKGSPRFCTARRRLSISSVGKGSLGSRIKGSFANSFLGSMSSRWSLSSKDGLTNFILNDNGIRLDPLVKRRKGLKEESYSDLKDIAFRSRSLSESWQRRRSSGLLTEAQVQHLRMKWNRSNSPAVWSQASGLRSLSPWQGSPGSGRQRYSSGKCYRRHHRFSEGDVLKNEKSYYQNINRKHRHSEGDVLSPNQSQRSPSATTRKRCNSEGNIGYTDGLASDESPKSAHKTNSKSSILGDDENEYVENIISSLRRNSITEKYRKDILKRNGFYPGQRICFDQRNCNLRPGEHKYRNSYCGSFGSLDSIDSWSSCDSIENIGDVADERHHAHDNTAHNDELNDVSGASDIVNSGPDIIVALKVDEDMAEEDGGKDKLETASWMDCSYWNWQVLRTDGKPRSWSVNSRNSRWQRVRELRRRSFGGYVKPENDFSRMFMAGNEEITQFNDSASLANLTEETTDIYENKTEDSEAEFSLLKDQVTFCSGKHGTLQNGGDDVELVFDAINKEANKLENSAKDLMVVFFVGKVLDIFEWYKRI